MLLIDDPTTSSVLTMPAGVGVRSTDSPPSRERHPLPERGGLIEAPFPADELLTAGQVDG
jgi:hypothetical protein